MEEKKIELMALSETRWTGQGVERIKNKTFIYSGADKDRNYGVAIALSNQARRSWEEAGSVFHPVSELPTLALRSPIMMTMSLNGTAARVVWSCW